MNSCAVCGASCDETVCDMFCGEIYMADSRKPRSTSAIAKRVLCFCAGPQTHEFYACEAHRDLLLLPWPLSLFFSHHSLPLETVDPEEEWSCYFCQEG